MRNVDEIMEDISLAEADVDACREAVLSTDDAENDLQELRKELKEALLGEHKSLVNQVCCWASSNDIDDAIDTLRNVVEKYTKKGYEFLGGVSIAVDNGKFYVMQTLIRKED